MKVEKGTPCFLSIEGHYNIIYMTEEISEINCNCEVEPLPFLNGINSNYIAIRTRTKYIGIHEEDSKDPHSIIVWIHK